MQNKVNLAIVASYIYKNKIKTEKIFFKIFIF